MAKRATRCSKCGGEKDSDGWCPNYCMDGEEAVVGDEASCLACRDTGLKECPDCGGSGKDQGEPCAVCNGYCKVHCAHQPREAVDRWT